MMPCKGEQTNDCWQTSNEEIKMKKIAMVVLAVLILAGCGGRPPAEVSSQAKGWVGRLERAVKARNPGEISDICLKIQRPQSRLTESELRLFGEVCAFCEDEKWEKAEGHLRVMAGDEN